jgi:tRNA-dihydrouridine synthase
LYLCSVKQDGLYIAFAPLQGYTDAAYRRAHWECAGGVGEYYTPFVRIEKGEVRRKDLRDTDPEANHGVPTVPQVIARDGDELARLCDALQVQGWRRIDVNMGCPFPLQVRAGRGSGLLQRPDKLKELLAEMQRRPEVVFSVKMRLGQESTDEGLRALETVNRMPLCHVTLHARLGRQQYKGTPDLAAFKHFAEHCAHPMVYNGDAEVQLGVKSYELRVMADADGNDGNKSDMLLQAVPNLKGVMIGRGLLARPWMLGNREPKEVLLAMHERLYRHATQTLCGDSQVLARLRAFWEYIPLDHKMHKAIMKATTLARYREVVFMAKGMSFCDR